MAEARVEMQVGGVPVELFTSVGPVMTSTTGEEGRLSCQGPGLRSRAVSVYRSLKQHGNLVISKFKNSICNCLLKDRGDVDPWTLLLGLIYTKIFILLGLAAFSRGILDRSTLHEIKLQEPLFMYDSVESLEHASMITISVSMLFAIAGLLGCGGMLAKNSFILTLHYIILVLTFVPVIYHGFGREAAYGLPEWREKSSTMRLKLTHELTMDYGVNKVYGPPGTLCTTERWDHIQKSRGCCGIAPLAGEIYLSSEWYRNSTASSNSTESFTLTGGAPRVPLSCCVIAQDGGYVNQTLCQTTSRKEDWQGVRHLNGCDVMQSTALRDIQLRLCVLSLLLTLTALLVLILTLVKNVINTRKLPVITPSSDPPCPPVPHTDPHNECP